ncbi:GntR family transcriptional regulator [Chelativorans alearense]|uniref:GntR family transcriptional regulator n=1 Tax=Chelativorans alearense TaxID=2681495 RepID=UPI0013CF7352|nr:FCD domain-containing protein [Chelativorans alearense]
MAKSVPAVDTAGENAYRQIRHDIIFGKLQPGARLRLDGLKPAYLASISTLREILSRLSSERFVVAEGQRGFEVAPVSQQHFREVAVMRELLEGHALKESFERGDVEWEGRVVAAHHKLARMEARMGAGDRSETELWKRYDREFHGALISACGSRALMEAHRQIFDHYLRYQIIAVIYRGQAASDEHRQLLACAVERNHATAMEVLGHHIRSCVEHTLSAGLLAG